MKALNRLAKWRTVFAGWQLGTRLADDAECMAVLDHREATILMRAELNAILQLLVRKGVCTTEEFTDQLEIEADLLSKAYEKKFPGFKATDYGLEMNTAISADTMRGWPR